MSANGEFKYVNGWYAIFVKNNLVNRIGPFPTEEEARAEREKQLGVKNG